MNSYKKINLFIFLFLAANYLNIAASSQPKSDKLLFQAIEKGESISFIENIINDNELQLTQKNLDGNTPLLHAIKIKRLDALDVLIKRTAAVNGLDIRDNECMSVKKKLYINHRTIFENYKNFFQDVPFN